MSDLIESLLSWDVPTISNAIELFAVRPRTEGFADHSIREIIASGVTTIGNAVTATISSLTPACPDEQERLLRKYYELVRDTGKPAIAVIQDIDSSVLGSFWGEVSASMHLAMGCIGVITNGGVRDLTELKRLGFRCWASSILVSHGYVHLTSVGKPVAVGGLVISSGDIVAADQHGVLRIPNEVLTDLPSACEYASSAENPVLDPCRKAIESGAFVSVDDLMEWRKKMISLRSAYSVTKGQ